MTYIVSSGALNSTHSLTTNLFAYHAGISVRHGNVKLPAKGYDIRILS